MVSKKAGALPQEEMVSIKSGDAATKESSRIKNRGTGQQRKKKREKNKGRKEKGNTENYTHCLNEALPNCNNEELLLLQELVSRNAITLARKSGEILVQPAHIAVFQKVGGQD